MNDAKRLFYDDIREKSKISRSAKTYYSKGLSSYNERKNKSMEKVPLDQISTKEHVLALDLEERVKWLESIRKEPGFITKGQMMGGIPYHWFNAMLKRDKIKLAQITGEETIQSAGESKAFSMENRLQAMVSKSVNQLDKKITMKLDETVEESRSKIDESLKPINSALIELDNALKDVKNIGMANFEGGYFINRELEAENLSKRLSKLADSVGITDSRYKVTISLIELDDQ